MIDLRLAVTHVPDDPRRRADLINLKRRIPNRALEIVQDRNRQGVWPTTKQAWKRLWMGGGTHLLVLQEDMLPCVGFYDIASAALEANPDVPVCFFTSRESTLVTPARTAGVPWAAAYDAAVGGATAFPVHLLASFLKWEASNVDPAYPHDDGRVCMWAVDTKRLIWVTVPSLVQHMGSHRSLLGHGGLDRTAAWYADNPPEIDWTKGLHQPIIGKSMLGPVSRRELKRMRMVRAARET